MQIRSHTQWIRGWQFQWVTRSYCSYPFHNCKEEKFLCYVCHACQINHTCYYCIVRGNQTACVVHCWCVFEVTYRKSVRTITFLKFCAIQLNSWVIYWIIAGSICSDRSHSIYQLILRVKFFCHGETFKASLNIFVYVNAQLYSVIPRSYLQKHCSTSCHKCITIFLDTEKTQHVFWLKLSKN